MSSEVGPKRSYRDLVGVLRPWLVLALVCALFSLDSRFRAVFWTRAYLPNVLQQSARNIVLAVGMTFVILTGGIDLSVGSVLALSGVSLALSLSGGLPVWLAWVAALPCAVLVGRLVAGRIPQANTAARIGAVAGAFVLAEAAIGSGIAHGVAGGVKVEGAIAIALLVGIACGLVNGMVVSFGRVPPFVMTLGMLSASHGLTLYATDGNSVSAAPARLMALGQGVPLVGVVLSVVLLGTLLLKQTRLGRYLLAVGGNESAAHLSGVPVGLVKTLAYALAGAGAAIGAVLVTAKFGLADTNAGAGAELDAIAAVVVGGTRLTGGQGSIVGALVGALTITVIQAGLVLVGIRDTLQPVILGGVIVLAVLVDQVRRQR
jgi:ribose/xylose/arabinose/galactoside ABC-type transport system permease subunit